MRPVYRVSFVTEQTLSGGNDLRLLPHRTSGRVIITAYIRPAWSYVRSPASTSSIPLALAVWSLFLATLTNMHGLTIRKLRLRPCTLCLVTVTTQLSLGRCAPALKLITRLATQPTTRSPILSVLSLPTARLTSVALLMFSVISVTLSIRPVPTGPLKEKKVTCPRCRNTRRVTT